MTTTNKKPPKKAAKKKASKKMPEKQETNELSVEQQTETESASKAEPKRPVDPMPGSKYSMDAPFAEPVLRCDSCNKLVFLEDLKKHGRCTKCGNTKVKNLQIMNDEERAEIEHKNVDPDFLALFEAVT